LKTAYLYIENPKLHSKGKYKYYGEWQGRDKPPDMKGIFKAMVKA
jgi:hypothetical protein